tara:strand:+ start:4076 stop:5560 length:1485 start_codon:yes stop_codon:yes gene_type:complete
LIYRGSLIFFHDGYLGVDFGAYLLNVNDVLGDEPTKAGFPRPPLAPGFLLAPFLELWGLDIGYKIWSLIASILPIPVVYILSRKFLSDQNSLLATAFTSVDPFNAEMTVTGGLPIIGMSLYVLMIWGIIDIIQNKPKISNVSASLFSLALIPFINQTTAGITLVVLPLVFILIIADGYLDFWNKFNYKKYGAVFFTLLIGGLISLLSLPYYLQVLPGSGLMSYPGAWIYLAHDGVAWFTFLSCVPLGIFMMKKSSNIVEKIIALHLIVLGSLSIFLSFDETIINVFYRSRFFVRLFFHSSVIWLFVYLLRKEIIKPVFHHTFLNRSKHLHIPKIISVFFLCLFFITYAWIFDAQSKYSKIITNESEIAIEILEKENHKNIITNSFSLSLWIAGMEKVKSPHVWTSEPPKAYTLTDEHTRCILNWIENCDYKNSINYLDTSHILIEQKFPYFKESPNGIYLAPDNHWEITSQAHWLDLIYEKGSTQLYRINYGIN